MDQKQLEKLISESQQLRFELEEELVAESDPMRRSQLKRNIEHQKELQVKHQRELDSLSAAAPSPSATDFTPSTKGRVISSVSWRVVSIATAFLALLVAVFLYGLYRQTSPDPRALETPSATPTASPTLSTKPPPKSPAPTPTRPPSPPPESPSRKEIEGWVQAAYPSGTTISHIQPSLPRCTRSECQLQAAVTLIDTQQNASRETVTMTYQATNGSWKLKTARRNTEIK